jgi:imidazolonepropionase-like amidohydrolase
MIPRLVPCICLLASAASADLLIRDVTVVDVATGAIHPKYSILIHANQIAAVGAQVPARPGAQIMEGAGKYAIPGLWDMHVHLRSREQLALYPAYGITGVRDMGSDFNRVQEWRAEMESGKLLGPRVATCGPAVDGFPSADSRFPVKVVRSPSDARTMFDYLDDRHVDFFAVLPRLPRDAYFALIERARKWYSSVAGEVPATVTVTEAIDARQKSIEHMSGILLACSTEEHRLREPRALALERNDRDGFQFAESVAWQTFSAQKADVLFERMARFETRAVPTLVKLRASPGGKDLYQPLNQLLMRMQRAGVGIMAGSGGEASDALHEELELLVAAGFTPVQALRSATLEPGKFFDVNATGGAIEKGKTADLVLLDANPLADIRNTRKIAAVVVGGKYLPKVKLTAMKAKPVRE